ncbi:MAG: 50S ribosomal protein L14 [Parcubacteria group bacterium CG1_02_42_13]|uniref:Large ribosomal subunit protein uL14 n=1 Tax=Candidatus Colwellbacteria bacterium CG23_combo_of_CG06-09_8_20_14_all_42_19 TaxID=1974541 RepID=A0A2H0ANK6_9BACT|nr:MAG: 50S ribosomal protein L14 [Parcubacteria group bacterium CG1_02_42_13]PIP46440.1 MAG: 50S ribosomal protein L14 [Candidatus Colwellbacteria bacterium CG23_combo_of_CG06-09_8_20_14_all_42_19]
MVQERSILKVADNSGAKTIRVFRVLGGSKKRYARIGDIVIASVQVAEPRKPVKKKDIIRALIVRTKNSLRRQDGSYIRFDDNAAVLVEKKEPRATRIFGPIPRELKDLGYDKIISLAQDIV